MSHTSGMCLEHMGYYTIKSPANSELNTQHHLPVVDQGSKKLICVDIELMVFISVLLDLKIIDFIREEP